MNVLLEEDLGPVRRLTLNRPEVLNALSTELVEELSAALTRAAKDDDARVVVIRGAGRAFCAGYDLKEEAEQHAEHGTPDAAGWRDELTRSVDRMLELFDHPKPVIAEVHGYCLAGGCDLMMMCDLAVASDDALFGEPEIRFGSGVVTMVMPWLIGARKAKELLFTGEDRIPAEEARRTGLVNRVVPPDRLEEETLALANQIAVLDPVAISLTKRSINHAWEKAGFREALMANVELDAQIESAEVSERIEFNRIRQEQGLKAAIAWRDARFRDSGRP
ncbi:MAG TPA: enoyl-CoA hydratase-related protein [Actinomycetota bacterium]|nr:enoyl-CoA hydratase-related protein [Actinomycetota bacterium]